MKMFSKILGTGTSVAVALAISASTTQAANLLVNGSFESNTTTPNPIGYPGIGMGWSDTFGGGVFTQSSAQAQDGSFSLLAQNAPGNNWNPQGAYQIVSVTAGVSYTLSAHFLADTALTGTFANPVGVQLSFFDSSLVGLGNAPGAAFVPLGPLNTWMQYGVTGTAPAGTAYAAAYVWFMQNGQTATDRVYIDNASLTAAVVPEPTTLALAGLGGVAALSMIRRRKS